MYQTSQQQKMMPAVGGSAIDRQQQPQQYPPALSPLVLAIAAGPTVATWDCYSAELDTSCQPHHETADVTDIAWNHNGLVVASVAVPNDSPDLILYDPIALTSIHSQKTLDTFRKAWSSGKRSTRHGKCRYTCIEFGVKSRYLCLGESSGDVELLDLKKCVAVRQYSSPDGLPCQQACLDPTETMVLAMSRETFSIFRLKEGSILRTFSVLDHDDPKTSSLTAFHVSPFRQTPLVVAVGTDQGTIQVLEHTASSTSTTMEEPLRRKTILSLDENKKNSNCRISLFSTSQTLVGIGDT